MISSSKIKYVDFYRKIPRELTEASLSGAGLSIIAAFAMERGILHEVKQSKDIKTDKPGSCYVCIIIGYYEGGDMSISNWRLALCLSEIVTFHVVHLFVETKNQTLLSRVADP
ncbi:hypothetical protein V6N13_096794 [Hibiscus sabdariffa]|uniref:Uncharacterized protein n=1 Tax=Hibiscus sabdariffa TaxID=183260 RepID=A0ABR2C8X6_9ROSI